MSIDLGLFEFLSRAKHPGAWVDSSFGALAAFLGLTLAVLLQQIGLAAFLTNDPDLQFLSTVTLYIVCILVALVSWLFLTQLYLRSGQHPKLGLVYTGHASNMMDVDRVQQTLSTLYIDGKLTHSTSSLRYLPRRAVANAKNSQRHIKRYNLDLIVHITQSSTKDNPNHPAFTSNFHFPPNLQIQLPTLSAALQAMVTLAKARRSKTAIIHELLDVSAYTLHDQLLMLIAIGALFSRRWLDAANLLRYLDESLEQLAPTDKPPRSILRFFDATARLQACHFETKTLPSPDTLQKYRTIAVSADRYVSEIPHVATAIARIHYLSGDDEAALATIDRAIGAKPSTTIDLEESLDVKVVIAKAFLEFIHTNWQNAATWYARLLRHRDIDKLDWVNDLVPFANYVASFNIEGAAFLCALYMRIATMPVPDNQLQAAREWVQADSSHGSLGIVLRNAKESRSASPTSNTKSSGKSSNKKRRRRRGPK